ncbi:PTS sugar transporter subunit IIA [Thermotalea metallivorans]|uniref:PTS system fructose-specific EIIABC component n=1 Tax=Thermotalea metallivorans TaxID=520762 RepID=A0A140KZH3_9FIRM|nr:fructose PTS transporter subunit IIA [Thermotalea metallivorans]KXG73698.1 PTS system fructose-specific EIIABC component [Thermotalea metallivorans]
MEISDLLKRELMILDLQAQNKREVIEELITPLVDQGIVTDKENFIKTVMEREKQVSTGIGMGIAIPHGKSKDVQEPSIVFGKSKKGIDYESLDGQPSYIFFLIAVPEGSSSEHLRVLSQLSRKLMHEHVRKQLMEARQEEDVIHAFHE